MRIGVIRRTACALGAAIVLGACGTGSGRSDSTQAAPASAISPGARAADSGRAPDAASSGAARRAVLIVGTSLTAGYGLDDPAHDAYPAVLQRKADSAGLGVEIVNAGLSGETSAGALRRIDWLLQRYASRTDVVVIETGANDGLRAIDPDSTKRNLDSLVRIVKRRLPAATVLLAQMEAPPNLGADYTARFHAMYPAVARAEHATLLPFLLDGVAGISSLNQGDGIHPNVRGARKVADNVWPGIRDAAMRSAVARGIGSGG